jgi:hypothetical protein
MKTFFNKILETFVAAFACLLVVSCESKDSDTIQAEVVFPSDVNLTKIDQWESSIELEQLGTNIPIEIKSNSEWEIYFSFDDNCFCLAYPNKGVGNATVELCVFNNSADERCTGKMYIVFPKDLGKSHIVQLSQKGDIDNDDNSETPVPGIYCPVCKGFIPVKIQQLLFGDEILCPDCGFSYSINKDKGQSEAALEALRKVEEAIENLRKASNFK